MGRCTCRYSDFVDPVYEGHLTTIDDPFSNVFLFSKTLGHDPPNQITQEQLDNVVELMKQVKPNIVAIVGTFGDVIDILVRGDATLAFDVGVFVELEARTQGVELVTAEPEVDGSFIAADSYGIVQGTENLDTAYAFVNHMIGTEANATLNTTLGQAVTNQSSFDLLDPESQAFYPYDVVAESATGEGPVNVPYIPPFEPEEG